MLDNIKKEHINILHVLLVAPLLLWLGWKGHEGARDDQEKWIYRGVLLVGALVLLWHGWCLWKKYSGKIVGSAVAKDEPVNAEHDTDSDE